jgi:tRNA(Ile)-lysidine synthase
LHWDISNITGTASLLPLNVKFRGGSERVTKADGHHQSLKHYWQARGIPPWLRGHVPLLYHGSVLIAVGEEIMPDTILAHVVKNVSPLYWQRSHLLCGW